MRLTYSCIVLALVAFFLADRTLAQIPERITFQPGSFAYGYHPGAAVPGVAMAAPIATIIETDSDDAVGEEDDTPKTEWENAFGEGEKSETQAPSWETLVFLPDQVSNTVSNGRPPYLAWHRSPWTGRIHLIPYQPGYAEAPEQFPTHQSKLNLWLSTLPCREQNRPQQKYLGYYDPMPEILTDKPSRFQLILGYGDPNWTASCANSPWRSRMAHCPGVDAICYGPHAEASIADQGVHPGPLNGHGRGFTPVPYAGTMYRNPRGAFGYQRGFVPQQCPCPECVQQCPCPECPPSPQSVRPVQKSVCVGEKPACSNSDPCHDCANKRSCALQKSTRVLGKNAPKTK